MQPALPQDGISAAGWHLCRRMASLPPAGKRAVARRHASTAAGLSRQAAWRLVALPREKKPQATATRTPGGPCQAGEGLRPAHDANHRLRSPDRDRRHRRGIRLLHAIGVGGRGRQGPLRRDGEAHGGRLQGAGFGDDRGVMGETARCNRTPRPGCPALAGCRQEGNGSPPP